MANLHGDQLQLRGKGCNGDVWVLYRCQCRHGICSPACRIVAGWQNPVRDPVIPDTWAASIYQPCMTGGMLGGRGQAINRGVAIQVVERPTHGENMQKDCRKTTWRAGGGVIDHYRLPIGLVSTAQICQNLSVLQVQTSILKKNLQTLFISQQQYTATNRPQGDLVGWRFD